MDGAMIVTDGAEDFPYNLADYLAECRIAGLTFDQAWTRRISEAARDAGFSWKQQPFAVEASVPFMKRHLRAAYEGYETMRYCVEENCNYLAVIGDQCAICADSEGKVAA